MCDGGAGDSRAFPGRRVFAASASMLRAPCIEMHRCACVEGAVGIVAEASVTYYVRTGRVLRRMDRSRSRRARAVRIAGGA